MTDQQSLTTADLTTLSKEQLIAMIAVRGLAMRQAMNIDDTLWTAILSGSFTHKDFTAWYSAKEKMMLDFGQAETDILFPAGEGQRPN